MQAHGVHQRTDDIITEPPPLSDADYEQMYHYLYEYRFGRFTFLELLARFEEALHVHTPGTDNQNEAA